MKWMRRLWVGAGLLLAFSSCSEEGTTTITAGGVYSPLITGIAADNEPAIRGVANVFTAIVTNVNGYPITYHWSAGSGVLTDSTGETATWEAPDTIGTYSLTLSIESTDGAGAMFFKTTTYQVFVDNEIVRWTEAPDAQFDPAPTPEGGVLYAQYRNTATGEADVYEVTPSVTPSGIKPGPLKQWTSGFFTASSPTMRADGQQIAFQGRKASNDSVIVWLHPGVQGEDYSPVGFINGQTSNHKFQGTPRFARTGNWLLYGSDSSFTAVPRPWYRDAFTYPYQGSAPFRVIEFQALSSNVLWSSNWGPDINADDLPDSIVCPIFRFFGTPSQVSLGLYKFPTSPEQFSSTQWLNDITATEPDWSPDGNHIVFAKRNAVTGDRDIWIINAASEDPSTEIRVTSGPADDSHPRFSADGSKIFFVSNRTSHYGLNGIFNVERRGTNIWSVARFERP